MAKPRRRDGVPTAAAPIRRSEGAPPPTEASDPVRRSALRENFESIIVAVLFALFVRTFVAQPYKIPSGSMEENLLVGDHVAVNKVLHAGGSAPEGLGLLPVRKVRRGDVVIFRPPGNDGTDYIKRVIGLPGEVLTLTYSPERNGVRVAIDGSPLPESHRLVAGGEPTPEEGARWTVNYTGDPPEVHQNGWFTRTVTLGPEQYFMMGDNRNHSEDSRWWGPVDAERIRGKALFIYWSYEAGSGEEPEGLGRRLVHYGRIALHFFDKSRWDRTFRGLE